MEASEMIYSESQEMATKGQNSQFPKVLIPKGSYLYHF